MIGLITLARVADLDPQWQKTICGAIAQDRQFSWVLDYRLATKRADQVAWQRAMAIAGDLLDGVGTRYLLPHGWECARYYKRTDGKGVSQRGGAFFAKLEPVARFGSHTAYREKRGCRLPLKTT
jgi:spore germination cell wall hydrolase CwlJ-like protein